MTSRARICQLPRQFESDFNDYGLSGILFQNTSSGQVSIWEMNGNNVDRWRGRTNFPAGVNNQFGSRSPGGRRPDMTPNCARPTARIDVSGRCGSRR
jgi:hypothetical protein